MTGHPITFGTDGWRGIISREVTYGSMTLAARAVARVLGAGARVLVGYDTRFLSPEYGQLVAGVLLDEGVDAELALEPCPSPALSWAVAHRGAGAGLMITASHNPPIYSGIKIKCEHGGPAPPAMITAIARACDDMHPATDVGARLRQDVPLFDPRQGYLEAILAMIDHDSLRSLAGRTVVVDPFHGSAAGYVPELLAGTGINVVEARAERNPGFGGTGPEPRHDTAAALGRAVRDHGACVGLMFDGDGDRLAAWDEPHLFIHPQQVFLLLLDHMARGRSGCGSVVRTTAVTSMVDRLASTLDLPLIRRPVGFGHVCREMVAGGVLIGGEEAGGFGFSGHIPDRDGLLAALLLLEMMGSGGRSLSERLEGLFAELGRLHFDRVDVLLKDSEMAALGARLESIPSSIAGLAIVAIQRDDGLRLELERSSWLLIRASGTEPLLRIYGEAPDRGILQDILREGTALVAGR